MYFIYPYLKVLEIYRKKIHLAKNVSPYDNKFIVRSYREATSSEFTYLLFDFHQKTPEKFAYDQKYSPVKEQ